VSAIQIGEIDDTRKEGGKYSVAYFNNLGQAINQWAVYLDDFKFGDQKLNSNSFGGTLAIIDTTEPLI